jgi:hypothetical protein
MRFIKHFFKSLKKIEIENIVFLIISLLAVIYIVLAFLNRLSLFPELFQDLHKYLLTWKIHEKGCFPS